MNDILRSFIFIPTILNFILLAACIYKCRNEFDAMFKEAGRAVLFAIAAIFLLSLFLRATLLIPKHLLFNDEFYHMITAKSILQHANLGIYYKSLGWSSILAIVFAVFGISNYVAISTSVVFGALTVINMALLVYLVFKDKSLAMLSAFVFGLMPYHIFWSVTAESNIASIFFMTFSIVVMLMYFQGPTGKLLWLSLLSISFAAQIRPENYILFAVFIAGSRIFLNCWPVFKEDQWLIAAMLSLPNLVHAAGYHYQVIIGPSRDIFANIINWFPEIFDGSLYPFLFVVFFCIGFFYLWAKRARYQVFLFSIFMGFFLIYFYGWYDITVEPSPFWAKTRFYMGLYPVLTVWFAAGVWFIVRHDKSRIRQKIAVILVAGAFFCPDMGHLKKLKAEDRFLVPHILETAMLGKIETELSPECLVVAASPETLKSSTSIRTLGVYEFIANYDTLRRNRCILFFEDYYCIVVRKDRCERMKKMFYLVPVSSYGSGLDPGAARYTFYRIVGKK